MLAAVAIVVRDYRGAMIDLAPIDPDQATLFEHPKRGRFWMLTGPDGTRLFMPDEDVVSVDRPLRSHPLLPLFVAEPQI